MTYHPLPTNPPQHDDYSAFVLGLVAGAAVGGGLALLFAPQEGAQTRHGLAAGAQQAGKRVTQAYGSLAGTARRSARRFVGHDVGVGVINEGGADLSVSRQEQDRARPAADVLRDAVGESTYTPASTPATTSGPGATSPAPDDSRSPLV